MDTIILHCSDSPDERASVNAAEIDRWHKERGFKMIGYHFVVLRDGTVEKGRDLEKIGAHCRGANMFSVGICWVGRHKPTEAQIAAIDELIDMLIDKYDLEPGDIKGHYEFDPGKTCPNLDMNEVRARAKKRRK